MSTQDNPFGGASCHLIVIISRVNNIVNAMKRVSAPRYPLYPRLHHRLTLFIYSQIRPRNLVIVGEQDQPFLRNRSLRARNTEEKLLVAISLTME